MDKTRRNKSIILPKVFGLVWIHHEFIEHFRLVKCHHAYKNGNANNCISNNHVQVIFKMVTRLEIIRLIV